VVIARLKWKKETALSQWVEVNRTLTHFNDIIQKTRQLTATVVLAADGAALAAFSSNNYALSVAIILLGFLALFVGYTIDKNYYFKLLLAAVRVSEELEKKYDFPAKLTMRLSKEVQQSNAETIVIRFYQSGIVIGVVLIGIVSAIRFSVFS
jgi:hypothetical protein